MGRMKSLWKGSPLKLLAGSGAVLVAAGLGVGAGTNFNSTKAHPSNVFTGGMIQSSNSNSNANLAILTAINIVPGDTATGTVDIKNTGSAGGTFTLTHTAPDDTPASPGLSKKLNLTIVDQGNPTCRNSCPPFVTLYSGTIYAQPATIPLGIFAPGVTHRYVYTMTFPNGGPHGADNAYQSASTSVSYSWTSTS